MADGFGFLVETFFHDSESHLEQLRLALSESNSDSLRVHAHSFKGSSSSLGAMKLAVLCQQLEQLGRDNQLAQATELVDQLEIEYSAARAELQKLMA